MTRENPVAACRLSGSTLDQGGQRSLYGRGGHAKEARAREEVVEGKRVPGAGAASAKALG